MISFDNLFSLPAQKLGLEKPSDSEVSLVSHAHSDHLPTRYSKNHIYCSSITKKMILWRKKLEKINEYRHSNIKSLNAGHVLGSSMFLINKELLYTGDFNTKGIYCGKANPVKCKTLIMECTYGVPEFVFPSKEEVLNEMRDYIKEEKVIIMTMDSGFGKPQEVCHALDKYKIPFSVNERIASVNEILKLNFKQQKENAEVIITSPHVAQYYPHDYKRVFLTGWLVSEKWKYRFNFNKGFIFSNHCDYDSLIKFAEQCSPEEIYLHHGPAESFAQDLRKIGFKAAPLQNLTQKRRRGILQETLHF